MTVTAHIRELSAKHRRLDARIEQESRRPEPDSAELATLKKEKLRLKEQLTALQTK